MDKLDNKFINRLDDSSSLVDVLIQLENFLDNLDIYVFKNWFDGEVVDGPIIKKYWVGMVLLFNYDKMPDPEGAIILEKHGAKVKYFVRNIEDTSVSRNALDLPAIGQITDVEGGQGVYGDNSVTNNSRTVPNISKVWIVEIMIPRIFIDELNALDIDVYDSTSIDDMDALQHNNQSSNNESADQDNDDTTDNNQDLSDEIGDL